MGPFFLFESEEKTVEGHLKQMKEGLRNHFLFGLIKKLLDIYGNNLWEHIVFDL